MNVDNDARSRSHALFRKLFRVNLSFCMHLQAQNVRLIFCEFSKQTVCPSACLPTYVCVWRPIKYVVYGIRSHIHHHDTTQVIKSQIATDRSENMRRNSFSRDDVQSAAEPTK